MKRNFDTRYKNQNGFSIVELMIAVVIGLIITTGLITVFDTTSKMNRTQNGLARIQENGRFALLYMKQNIEQAGFQYCLSSGENFRETPSGTIQRPWLVYTAAPIFPGVVVDPVNFTFDTSYLIHGHECDAGGCSPGFDTNGSDGSYTIPSIGAGDGDRIAKTDVLTFRYISGSGKEVEGIVSPSSGHANIYLSAYSVTNSSEPLPSTGRVLVASCNDKPLIAADIESSSSGVITVQLPPGIDNIPGSAADLTRVFDLDRDVRSVTYYVANNIVDGRSIPTLYSVINGTVNALVEGVDRFDVLYGVGTGFEATKAIQYLTASEVQNLAVANCRPALEGLVNVAGCGWRGVEMIQIHLLLNTIQNSSLSDAEEFAYSVDGSGYKKPSDLGTGIDTYKMYRREFVASIALKNSSR